MIGNTQKVENVELLKEKSLSRKKILGVVKWLWMLLVILGTGYYFYQNWEQVTLLLTDVSLWRLFAALWLLILGKIMLVLLVNYSVKAEGWHPSFWQTVGIYGLTSLGKYIPGGIWHFVGRIGVYRTNHMDREQIIRAMVLENYWLLSSALTLGLSSLCFFQFDLVQLLLNINTSSIFGFFIGVLIFLIWIAATYLIHRFLDKHTREKVVPPFLASLISVVAWLLIGLSFFIMFPNRALFELPLFIGGYAVSWAVGYIAVFAPGGLGVREAALAFVFSNIASVEMIAVYAAMNRIIWVIAEVLFGLVGMVQKQGMQANQPEDENIATANLEAEKQIKATSLASDSQDMIDGE